MENIQNGLQEQNLSRAWNTAEVVIRCARIMRKPGNFHAAINEVLGELAKTIQPDRLYIVRAGKFHHTIEYEWVRPGIPSAKDIFREIGPNVIVGFGEYVQRQKGVPVIIEDIEYLKEEEPDAYREMTKRNLRNMISVSLYYDNKVFGNLACDNFSNSKLYDIKELMETVSFFLSSEIANQTLMDKLQILSNTDLLTNVFNRNAYGAMVAELKNKDQSVGIVYADLNGLKKINDSYGHEAGDRAIKRVAELLKEEFFRREIYRIGGDEFVVIMPQIPEDSFIHRKNRFIDQLRTADDISVSVGTYWCDSSKNIELAIKEADVAMYRRKKRYYDGTLQDN